MRTQALLPLFSLLLVLCSSAFAADNFTILEDAFPQLRRLASPPSNLSPKLGGQDFDYCCLKAVRDSFQIVNGSIVSKTTSFLEISGRELLASQFPCGAAWNGDLGGAPQVKVDWAYCDKNCPGFQRSVNRRLSQWVQPFVGFLIPSVVFCLSIPRRRKLYIPDWVFPEHIDSLKNFVWAIYCALIAALLVSLDTIVWLATVFALSGPLLLGGCYEAMIDSRVVDFMTEKMKNGQLPLPLRARILLTILVGNLDMSSAWDPAMDLVTPLGPVPQNIQQQIVAVNTPNGAIVKHPSDENTPNGAILKHSSDEISPSEPAITHQRLPTNVMMEELVSQSAVQTTKIRLHSMLACQYSFGSIVGAPVIFYIGSFVFSIIQIKSNLGDNDTANALAFGMWWVTLPHLSIVSGCLLAGNNPNTLDAITPSVPSEDPCRHQRSKWGRFLLPLRGPGNYLFHPTYNSHYKPAWMWDRGRNKREWILKLCEKYFHEDEIYMSELRKELGMSWGDWTTVSLFALSLFGLPCILGFLVAYFTPQIGLACRAMTFLMYACAQIWLLLLWMWNFTWRDTRWRTRRQEDISLRRNEALHSEKQITATATTQNRMSNHSAWTCGVLSASAAVVKRMLSATWIQRVAQRRPSAPEESEVTTSSRIGFLIFWTLMGIGLLAATFSAIGGTMMQIIGVYRNCLCKINIQHWRSRDAMLLLSTNNSIDIYQARHWWQNAGIAATAFLGFTCYIGWWYQKRLRFRFGLLVDKLDDRLPRS